MRLNRDLTVGGLSMSVYCRLRARWRGLSQPVEVTFSTNHTQLLAA